MMLKKRFDILNYEINRPLPIRIKNVIKLMRDKLGRTIMTEFDNFMTKTYSYLIDDGSGDKKAKETKKYVIKRILKFDNYKNCLQDNKILLKSQQIFKKQSA